MCTAQFSLSKISNDHTHAYSFGMKTLLGVACAVEVVDFRMRIGLRKGIVVVAVSTFAFWVDSMSAANLLTFLLDPALYGVLAAWFLASIALMTVLRTYYALLLPSYITDGRISIDRSSAKEWIMAFAIYGIPMLAMFTIIFDLVLRCGLYEYYVWLAPFIWRYLWRYHYHYTRLAILSLVGTFVQEPLRAAMYGRSRTALQRTNPLPAISVVGLNMLFGFLMTFPPPHAYGSTSIFVILYLLTILIELFLLWRYYKNHKLTEQA